MTDSVSFRCPRCLRIEQELRCCDDWTIPSLTPLWPDLVIGTLSDRNSPLPPRRLLDRTHVQGPSAIPPATERRSFALSRFTDGEQVWLFSGLLSEIDDCSRARTHGDSGDGRLTVLRRGLVQCHAMVIDAGGSLLSPGAGPRRSVTDPLPRRAPAEERLDRQLGEFHELLLELRTDPKLPALALVASCQPSTELLAQLQTMAHRVSVHGDPAEALSAVLSRLSRRPARLNGLLRVGPVLLVRELGGSLGRRFLAKLHAESSDRRGWYDFIGPSLVANGASAESRLWNQIQRDGPIPLGPLDEVPPWNGILHQGPWSQRPVRVELEAEEPPLTSSAAIIAVGCGDDRGGEQLVAAMLRQCQGVSAPVLILHDQESHQTLFDWAKCVFPDARPMAWTGSRAIGVVLAALGGAQRRGWTA